MKLWKTLLAGAAMIASVAAAHAQEINFGIISTDSSAALRQRWQPLIDDMEKQTGLKVTPFFATDYAGVIEGMRGERSVGPGSSASRSGSVQMVRDPACGTFVLPDRAVTVVSAGRQLHFCSTRCRDAFLARPDSPERARA